jgi:hypothetical protein
MQHFGALQSEKHAVLSRMSLIFLLPGTALLHDVGSDMSPEYQIM